MQVFIGNATKQILHFAYRLAERKAPITQVVPMLRQIKLGVDLTEPDVDSIIEHWGKYGLIKPEELDSHRRNFHGYLISINKPITQAVMEKAAKYREEVLRNKGTALRKEAALAMVNTIEAQTQTPAAQYEISVSEEIPEGGFAHPDDVHVSEGYRVTHDRPNMPEPSGRGRSRRAA